MSMQLANSAKKIQEFLIEGGFSCEVKELPSSTRTAVEAASSIGCDIAQIAKSLVFIDQIDNPVLVIASGVNQVDLKKIELLTGLCLKKADAQFVKDRVGFAIGGVPPVGHIQKIKTLLDPSLKEHKWIWAAAGTPFAVFRVSSTEIEKMTDGMFIDLKVDK